VNVADILRDVAETRPAGSAILFHGHITTFVDLDDRVDLTAAALASLGVGRGDRVAIVAGNVPEFVDALYGTMRAGAVACPLNVMLTPPELASILADAGAKVVVTELAHLPNVLEARSAVPSLQTVVVIGGPPAPVGTVSLEEALTRAGDPPPIETAASDPAVIAYTAGTTSDPKGALLTHGNLMANLDQMIAVPAIAHSVDDVILLALPLSHIYAMNAILGLCLRAGAMALLVERFDPVETAELIERHGVTVLFGAPPMFAAWIAALRDGSVRGAAFSTVRMAASGAAALPPEVFTRFLQATGVTIWEGYGLTESAPAVSTTALGEAAKPGSIGLPLPGLELRLVDEHGEEAEEGDPGEILVRGPNVFAGYWNRPEETAAVLDGAGWLHTGDVAYRDEDGYLFLVDRKKDLIIVSGFNVYPKEVEEAIASDPRVEEVAAIGVADERTGEAIEAWVVPKAGGRLTPDDVLAHLAGHLARFKMPKVVNVVDDLPHHVTGKILHRALRHGPGESPSRPVDPDEPARSQL
jgi:long-chain acyl-CoA synthetase